MSLIPCAGCGKPAERRGGGKKWCPECLALRKRQSDQRYAAAHRAEAVKRARAWTANNRDRVNARYANLSPERRHQRYLATLAREGAEKRRRAAREYYWKNREKILARMSSAEGRRYSRDQMRERMLDPGFRLHSNISRAVRASIADKQRRKWEDLVGYTLADLTAHIERQFTNGMTWANHGRGPGSWNVDHIIPRCSFSFTTGDDPEFLQCWALSNLQPLWWEQNIAKGGRRIQLI